MCRRRVLFFLNIFLFFLVKYLPHMVNTRNRFINKREGRECRYIAACKRHNNGKKNGEKKKKKMDCLDGSYTKNQQQIIKREGKMSDE